MKITATYREIERIVTAQQALIARDALWEAEELVKTRRRDYEKALLRYNKLVRRYSKKKKRAP